MPELAGKQSDRIHRARHRSGKHRDFSASIFSNFRGGGNPTAMKSVSYSGTIPTDKMQPPPDSGFSFKRHRRDFQ
jgi:hypothetical protein